MNVANILHRACPDMGEMAEKAGLSADYVRHLARPNGARPAGYAARHKLAKAFRDQAAQLEADAAQLEAWGG